MSRLKPPFGCRRAAVNACFNAEYPGSPRHSWELLSLLASLAANTFPIAKGEMSVKVNASRRRLPMTKLLAVLSDF
jgi:hypothetical protein